MLYEGHCFMFSGSSRRQFEGDAFREAVRLQTRVGFTCSLTFTLTNVQIQHLLSITCLYDLMDNNLH